MHMIIPFQKKAIRLNKTPASFDRIMKTPKLNSYPINNEVFYIYKMQSENLSQIGLVCLMSFADNSTIKIYPHELTCRENENTYFNHLLNKGEQLSPVIFVHKRLPLICTVINKATQASEPAFSITKDNIIHSLWEINNPHWLKLIAQAYSPITDFYIADGHHRIAATKRLKQIQPQTRHIASLLMQDTQVHISSFHRIVHFSNHFSKKCFMQFIKKDFTISMTLKPFHPTKQEEFGLYIDRQWFIIRLKKSLLRKLKQMAPIGTNIFEWHILSQHKNYNLHYLEGNKNLTALELQVNSLKNAVGFTVAAIAVSDFLRIAKLGNLLPPYSTCFFPKPLPNVLTYSN